MLLNNKCYKDNLSVFFMKKLVLAFFACFAILGFVSGAGENISLEYPTNVVVGSVFQVNLTLLNFSGGVYDVKIYIYNLTTSNRLSKISNSGVWQSTFNYIEGAINTSSSNFSVFSLNITENFNGTANITVSIRKSGGSPDSFGGYTMSITPASSQNTTNSTANTTNSTNSSSDISLDLGWDEGDIVNGENFSITVRAYNLLDEKYDIKVWIEDDNGKIISDRYGNYSNRDIKWASGKYWAYKFIKGPGNESEDIMIRIQDGYNDFSGDATIKALISESDSGKEKGSFEDSINIIGKNAPDSSAVYESFAEDTDNTTPTNSNNDGVIILGAKSASSINSTKQTNSIIYKSKTEYIKEYTPYALGILCIVIIILLLLDKKR